MLDTRPRQDTTLAATRPQEHFTTGQVIRLTGVSARQLDHWVWSELITPSGGTRGDETGIGHARQFNFTDLVRIRAVAELRRQGATLQLIRKAVERLQQTRSDPLRELKLVALNGEIYVVRSWQELERATDGQLSWALVDVGAILRQLEGRLATLRPAAKPAPHGERPVAAAS